MPRSGSCAEIGCSSTLFMTPEISVILPARNEAARMSPMIRQTHAVLWRMEKPFEMLIIDDHSSDDTAGIARALAAEHPEIQALRNDGPSGKGAALRKGASLARGSVVVFLDADGDLPPAQLPVFLDPLLRHEADVLAGSKHLAASDVQTWGHRKLLSTFFMQLVRFLFRLPVRDTQTGLKAFSRRAAEIAVLPSRCNGYGFDLQILRAAARANLRVLERAVTVRSNRTTLGALRPGPLLQGAGELLMLLFRD